MKKRMHRALLVLLTAGTLVVPTVDSKAAVITSNATDKIAVIFDENTVYSAGDYVLHDEELYICINDIQGAWDTAKESFLQVTKNHELGQGDELSAEYQSRKDPSEEKSLMAFVANVWQKLKDFFGMNQKTAATDKEGYTEAPVSAKLNYLKTQNEGIETQNKSLETQNNELKGKFDALQEKVNNSFTSVSNGKSLLANAITGKGVTVSSSATFEQFKSSIFELCGKERKAGQAEADGRVNKDSESYKAGQAEADGRVNKDSQSYKAGMEDADKRVNTDSESYKKGKEEGEIKKYVSDVEIVYDGPTTSLQEGESFEYYYSGSYFKGWNYTKSLPGHKILYVLVTDEIQSYYGGSSSTKMAILVDGKYSVLDRNSDPDSSRQIVVSADTLRLNNYLFNSTYADSTVAKVHVQIYYV